MLAYWNIMKTNVELRQRMTLQRKSALAFTQGSWEEAGGALDGIHTWTWQQMRHLTVSGDSDGLA